MTSAIIPAGEQGEFRITDQMLMEMRMDTWAPFEALVREEARARGLDLELLRELPSEDVIVRWRPGAIAGRS